MMTGLIKYSLVNFQGTNFIYRDWANIQPGKNLVASVAQSPSLSHQRAHIKVNRKVLVQSY